ncbi:hypothetical protein [Stieleria varia]|nr:hypothetical protein [Stieleria varia]
MTLDVNNRFPQSWPPSVKAGVPYFCDRIMPHEKARIIHATHHSGCCGGRAENKCRNIHVAIIAPRDLGKKTGHLFSARPEQRQRDARGVNLMLDGSVRGLSLFGTCYRVDPPRVIVEIDREQWVTSGQ